MHKILRIQNFKCFSDIHISLQNLTVLAGKNSAGKSSITQALRLFKEAEISDANEIHLNSKSFQFGTFDEVINGKLDKSGIFKVSLKSGDQTFLCDFERLEESEFCEYIKVNSQKKSELSDRSPLNFVYLSAERFGPRLQQETVDGHNSAKINVGDRGEYCAEVLANNFTTSIDEKLAHYSLIINDSEKNLRLSTNLEKWMSEIVGEINIRANKPPRLAKPYLEFLKLEHTSDWKFPTNHGFGISYTLPIVLACLLLEPEGVLIVDSPEAHLHPAAQTALAKFLAMVAGTRRNIIIETHSDHILDGLRVAIADPENPLDYTNAIFNYFDRDEDGDVVHHEIFPRADGSLPKWPMGFFDQLATNLKRLSDIKRKNG